jgi:outer membrane protein TolC
MHATARRRVSRFRGSRLRRSRLAILGLLTLACRLPAQEAVAPEGITLQEALETAIEHGAQLQLGVRQLAIAEGALLTARAPFDAELTTSLSTARSNGTTPLADGHSASALTRTVASSVALSKRFDAGLAVAPRVDVVRSLVAGATAAPTSRANIELDVMLPLLRDRGGSVTAAAERAAHESLDASLFDARHTAAASVLAVAVAYWDDLAAEARLEVYRSSEQRASRLVDDTRRLVDADERPAADLQQLRANLALKRAARLAGEQASVEARERLALAMGVGLDASTGLPRASTHFPDAAAKAAAAQDSAYVDATKIAGAKDSLAATLRARADLSALKARSAAARVQLGAARSALRPRLDLTVALGYQGLALDRGVGGALSSLYSNVPGLDASVQLSYELPLGSLAARGETVQSIAAYDQARIREAELRREIASGVRVARQALHHGRETLFASREAVAFSREAVENEKRKFQLGMSTLFDVILAEDALTNARLGEITGQQAYAVAIARLRYETGSIVDGSGERWKANAALLEHEP